MLFCRASSTAPIIGRSMMGRSNLPEMLENQEYANCSKQRCSTSKPGYGFRDFVQ
jgi:hypothetical protein